MSIGATTAAFGRFTTATITSTVTSTSTTTGALTVAGGLGVGGNIYATAMYDNNSRVITSATLLISIVAGTDTYVSSSSGIISIWSTATLQSITNRSNSTTNAIYFTNTAQSTSTSTGAILIPNGGIGLGGNIYIGGYIAAQGGNVTSDTVITGIAGTGTTSTGVFVSVASTSSGVGSGATFTINKVTTGTAYSSSINLTVVNPGVNYAVNDTITIPGASLGGTTPANNLTFTLFGGVATNGGITTINNRLTVASTSSSVSTTTGALVVAGGAGIGGRLNVGGNVSLGNTGSNVGIGGPASVIQGTGKSGTYLDVQGFLQITPPGQNGGIDISSYNGYRLANLEGGQAGALGGPYFSINLSNSTVSSSVSTVATFSSAGTASTSSTTGALVVTGGVGVGGSIVVSGGVTSTNHIVTGTAASTSTTTGALIVAGGVGVGGSVNIQGALTVGPTTTGSVVASFFGNNFAEASYTSGIINSGQAGVIQYLDQFSSSTYRTAEYMLQVVDTGTTPPNIHVQKLLVFHDGVNIYETEYAIMTNNGELGEFETMYTGTNVALTFRPTSPQAMTVKMVRFSLTM
jgi:hypothetical protein